MVRKLFRIDQKTNSNRNKGVFLCLDFLKPLADKMVNSQDYATRLFSLEFVLLAHHLHKVQFRNAETVRQLQSHLLL
jgi:hypothetical protein